MTSQEVSSPLSSPESKIKTEVRTVEDRAFLTTHPWCVSILKEMSSSGNPSFFRSKYKIHPLTWSSLRIKDLKILMSRRWWERATALFNVFTFPVWNVLTQYNVLVQQNHSSRQGGHCWQALCWGETKQERDTEGCRTVTHCSLTVTSDFGGLHLALCSGWST